MSSRHISRPCNLQPHQQRYANKISNQKSKQFLNPYIIVCFPKYFLFIFVIGGDTPFCAFGYEIIDFYLIRKKLVAATGSVQKIIQQAFIAK